MPDSIVIINNTYTNSDSENDNLYRTNSYSVILDGKNYLLNSERMPRSKILNLLAELVKPGNTDNSLAKYELDTNWIKSNPANLLVLYSNKDRIAWNEQQKDFIFKELTNLSNHKEELNNFISIGGNFSMHSGLKNEYVLKFYNNGAITNAIRSRKYVWGYKMPWINQAGDSLYNFKIEESLKDILSSKGKLKEYLKGKELQKYLVNKIIENNMRKLYELSAYSYKKEIDELNSDFKIISFEELYGSGRYSRNETKTMEIVLKNKLMYDNVNLVFLASKQGNTIYSRDSIKKDYANYIYRIQSVKFISDYLKTDTNTRLDIYYFNNKGINDYNIQNVNKDSASWARHDKWIETLKQIEKNNIKLSIDIEQSIKNSEQIYCGCNYRYEKDYIAKAIFFEVRNSDNSSSVWFLLPDDKVLLYFIEGSTALNFKRSDFTDKKEYGLIYPCVLFDLNGKKISK